jgi:C4-dicarboxylate-binding protein DctP
MNRLSNKTKWLLLCMLVMMLAIVTACGGGNETNGSTSEGNQQASAGGSQSSQDVIKVRFSHNLKEDTVNGQAVAAFKEKLEELTNGKMQVEIYPNQQLGAMREQAEQTQMGSIEITLQGTSVLSPFDPSIGMLDLPFLFPDDETMRKVLQGEVGQEVLATLDDYKLKGLGFTTGGSKQMTTKDFPINSPDDLKGVKFRVLPSDLLIDMYKAWGANPTPIDFAELYNSLQQGVVVGEENPLETIYSQKYYEVQKNLSITNHAPFLYIIAANKAWYDGLSDENRKAVNEAAAYASDYSFDHMAAVNQDMLKKLEEGGMIVNQLPQEGRVKFIQLSQSVYDKYLTSDKDKALFGKLQEAAKAAQ